MEPRAVIPGNGEYHVETGSTITLDCIIEQVTNYLCILQEKRN